MNDHLTSMIIMYSFYLTVGITLSIFLSILIVIIIKPKALCLLDMPEKLVRPGTLDIIGFSHQIFHLGIFAGVISEWAFFYSIQQQSQ